MEIIISYLDQPGNICPFVRCLLYSHYDDGGDDGGDDDGDDD